MDMINNDGFKLPTDANELIARSLVDRWIAYEYILSNEQKRVLQRRGYLKQWEWYIRKR